MATLNISITVPDENSQLFLDKFAKYHRYDANVHGTKANFVKIKVLEFTQNAVNTQILADANEQAIEEAQALINSITLT